jgi:hypothetical protein
MPKEMQAPPRAVPANDNEYFELISKAVFLAGFRWSVVESKWPGFQAAFAEFDIDRVAAFDPPDIERLMSDDRIVRNGQKIRATVDNAGTCRDLVAEHGSIKAWLDTSAHMTWPERQKDVAKPFKFIGPFGVYFFLWSVGESVPPHELRETWDGTLPPGAPESLA